MRQSSKPQPEWGCVYVVQMEGHPWLKIGHTIRLWETTALERLGGLQVGCPLPLTLLKLYPCKDAGTVEKRIHAYLAKDRRRGEWFETTLETIDQVFHGVLTHDPLFLIPKMPKKPEGVPKRVPKVFSLHRDYVRQEARTQRLALAAQAALAHDIQHFTQLRQRERAGKSWWQWFCECFRPHVLFP